MPPSSIGFKLEKFEKTLKRSGHKNLIACGFNLRACVLDTVLDARKRGFNVTLLEDLSGDDDFSTTTRRSSLAVMKNAGVHISTSAQILSAIVK